MWRKQSFLNHRLDGLEQAIDRAAAKQPSAASSAASAAKGAPSPREAN
jgi:hypothetical protein